jgi:hypothetical protein
VALADAVPRSVDAGAEAADAALTPLATNPRDSIPTSIVFVIFIMALTPFASAPSLATENSAY